MILTYTGVSRPGEGLGTLGKPCQRMTVRCGGGVSKLIPRPSHAKGQLFDKGVLINTELTYFTNNHWYAAEGKPYEFE